MQPDLATVQDAGYSLEMARIPTMDEAVRAARLQALKAALVAANGNVRAASKILNIGYSTCWLRIKEYNLNDWLEETYPAGERIGDAQKARPKREVKAYAAKARAAKTQSGAKKKTKTK